MKIPFYPFQTELQQKNQFNVNQNYISQFRIITDNAHYLGKKDPKDKVEKLKTFDIAEMLIGGYINIHLFNDEDFHKTYSKDLSIVNGKKAITIYALNDLINEYLEWDKYEIDFIYKDATIEILKSINDKKFNNSKTIGNIISKLSNNIGEDSYRKAITELNHIYRRLFSLTDTNTSQVEKLRALTRHSIIKSKLECK